MSDSIIQAEPGRFIYASYTKHNADVFMSISPIIGWIINKEDVLNQVSVITIQGVIVIDVCTDTERIYDLADPMHVELLRADYVPDLGFNTLEGYINYFQKTAIKDV